jgi:hypothetical protein
MPIWLKGIANLSNNRDYSQTVKHVNANRSCPLALTSCLAHTSSKQPNFLAHLGFFY